MPRLDEAELFEDFEEVREEPEQDRGATAAKRPSRAPWLLLVLALLGGAGAAGWLGYELQRSRGEVAGALRWLDSARKELADARAQRVDLATRLGQAEVEKRELVEAKDALSRDVHAKELELAALRSDLERLQKAKAAAKAPARRSGSRSRR